jgi:NAD dependent epimerase/dehydratase
VSKKIYFLEKEKHEKKMKVLVTGADGFIGSHLVELLVKEGFEVRAFVFYNSFNSWGWLDQSEYRECIEIVAGDIRDFNIVKKAVEGCSWVFHLAALIAIPYSYSAPQSYVETNIVGTLNVLMACKETGTQRIFITSTSEVYGTAITVPIKETHPKQAQSPYSATKIGADSLAESFRRSYNLPVTIVRPFNTYGPRQSARAVIPSIIIQLLTGKKEIHLGSLETTRDFVYVGDTVNGFIKIARSDKTDGLEINIATGNENSIGDIAKVIIDKININAVIIRDKDRIRPDKSEVERLLGDNSLLVSLTNWKPTTNILNGLDNTIHWFSLPENLTRYKSMIFNL